jgi:hypothetical protein
MSVPKISNKKLSPCHIPAARANWNTVSKFALTFDGYKVWGSFHACAEIANARRHDTLTDLRTCLFFEQRRWRHFAEAPDRKAMRYVRNLIELIRERVSVGDVK